MRSLTALACAALAPWASPTSSQAPSQGASSARFAETIEWIKSKIDGERTDNVGIHITTRLSADGCRVSFSKVGGTLTLQVGRFFLKDIAYIDVADQPVGTRWMGAFLVFRTADSKALITEGGQSLGQGGLVERPTTSFRWHLGSVPVGTSTAELRELGTRLRNAFVHAVELCGGTIKKEPF